MNPFTGIIIDFDGTLADTPSSHYLEKPPYPNKWR